MCKNMKYDEHRNRKPQKSVLDFFMYTVLAFLTEILKITSNKTHILASMPLPPIPINWLLQYFANCVTVTLLFSGQNPTDASISKQEN